MVFKKIGIASDHAGKDLKRMVVDLISLLEIEYHDYGVSDETEKSVDYPDYAKLLSEDVINNTLDGAIAICGTGLGMAIVSNKFRGIRATTVWDEYSCKKSREHNNANILCLGARTLNHHRACELIKLWLQTPFLGDRHKLRLDKIRNIEQNNFNSQ